MAFLEYPNLAITIVSWTGWTIAACIALARIIRSRNVSFEVIEEYDEVEDIDRVILMARIVIRQSKRETERVMRSGALKE